MKTNEYLFKSIIRDINNCGSCGEGRHLNDHQVYTIEILEKLELFFNGKTDEQLKHENKMLLEAINEIEATLKARIYHWGD